MLSDELDKSHRDVLSPKVIILMTQTTMLQLQLNSLRDLPMHGQARSMDTYEAYSSEHRHEVAIVGQQPRNLRDTDVGHEGSARRFTLEAILLLTVL